LHNGQAIVFTPQIVQTGGRQTKPVSGFSGGEEGGYCEVLIVGHDGAMLASKCEIYQVNSGKWREEVALGRLAIRADLQGQGLGQLLLADAISRARNAAQAVGSAGIVVDAKDDAAARFYQHHGFVICDRDPIKLFLAMWS